MQFAHDSGSPSTSLTIVSLMVFPRINRLTVPIRCDWEYGSNFGKYLFDSAHRRDAREAVRARAGSDGSRMTTGRTRAGRLLRVIYVADPEPKSVFVMAAYELRGKSALASRWRRRKLGP